MPRRAAEIASDNQGESCSTSGVFLRYAFRTTRVEEVARAGEMSRQAFYLHLRAKKSYFRQRSTKC